MRALWNVADIHFVQYPTRRKWVTDMTNTTRTGIAFIVAGLLALTATETIAQNRNLQRRGIDLTDEQQEQVKQLIENQKSNAQNAREALNGAIVDLLTDEQKQRIVEAAVAGRMTPRTAVQRPGRTPRASRKQRPIQTPRATRSPRATQPQRAVRGSRTVQGAALMRGLNLSTEQREQVSALLDAERKGLQEWQSSNPDATRAQRLEQARERRAKTQTAIKELLTDEQAAQFERMSDQTRRGFRGAHRR